MGEHAIKYFFGGIKEKGQQLAMGENKKSHIG